MSQIIMMVDDDPQVRALVSKLLTNKGYDVRCSDSGLDAVALAREIQPDLILLDLEMPGKNGFEVLADLQTDEQAMNIPVIMFSARSQVDDKVAGLDLGSVDYVVKPVHPDELLARIRAALKR
ncbi:MAG: response regulator [Chloroflexi bacterium]|jgi:DNA-binding response OmpR family regulator|nr:response regulator [Chloroflexota bacterium]